MDRHSFIKLILLFVRILLPITNILAQIWLKFLNKSEFVEIVADVRSHVSEMRGLNLLVSLDKMQFNRI